MEKTMENEMETTIMGYNVFSTLSLPAPSATRMPHWQGELGLGFNNTDLVVSEKKGTPIYTPKYFIILIMGTPPNGTPNFGKA